MDANRNNGNETGYWKITEAKAMSNISLMTDFVIAIVGVIC
jgi:hypothetical protein